MSQDMGYEVPERRETRTPRERITRSEFENRVRSAATHVASGLVLVNRDPDRWEREFAFSLEEFAGRQRTSDVDTDPRDLFTPDEWREIETLRSRIAESLAMTLARRFDLLPEPRLVDGSYDLDGE